MKHGMNYGNKKKLNDFTQDMRNIKEAIATLSASIVELEGRIKHLEEHIKEEEEVELAIKTKKEWWDI